MRRSRRPWPQAGSPGAHSRASKSAEGGPRCSRRPATSWCPPRLWPPCCASWWTNLCTTGGTPLRSGLAEPSCLPGTAVGCGRRACASWAPTGGPVGAWQASADGCSGGCSTPLGRHVRGRNGGGTCLHPPPPGPAWLCAPNPCRRWLACRRARPEVMTIGIKSVREICTRCPLVMTPELLQARAGRAAGAGLAARMALLPMQHWFKAAQLLQTRWPGQAWCCARHACLQFCGRPAWHPALPIPAPIHPLVSRPRPAAAGPDGLQEVPQQGGVLGGAQPHRAVQVGARGRGGRAPPD